MKRRGVAKASLVIIAAVAVATLASEGMVRLFSPQVTMFPRYVVSADYEVELPPDVQIEHAQGRKWRFTYSTNRLGRRGPYIPVQDQYATTNVVVLGDSFTFGIGVSDDAVYTRVLADQLGSNYQVINGGMSGWGIDSAAKWFNDVGSAYDPRIVVLQFAANDLFDSYTGVALVENGSFRFRPYAANKPLWQRLVSGSWLLQHSHLFSLVRSVISPGPQAVVPPSTAGETRRPPEENYVEMLETFAGGLAAANRALLFVSVTHADAATGSYGYDVDQFPLMRASIRRLEAGGVLRFVALPLDEMSNHKGSPEGHQWGVGHHRVVGTELAKHVLALRPVSGGR